MVVTAASNYHMSPTLMTEFLWRFDHLSAGEQGHNESIQLANLPTETNAWVWAKLGTKEENTLLYKYVLPGLKGKGYAYRPSPPSQMQSLISRCTHNLHVF